MSTRVSSGMEKTTGRFRGLPNLFLDLSPFLNLSKEEMVDWFYLEAHVCVLMSNHEYLPACTGIANLLRW
ncbi:MAG: hypothetical protein AB1611_07000 [bacterium]